MSGLGGLFELVLVLAVVLGWGFVELRANRRDRKKAEAARQPPSGTDETGPRR